MFFVIVIGPSFSSCEGCRAALVGLPCWRWRERGSMRYSCSLCCAKHARIGGAVA